MLSYQIISDACKRWTTFTNTVQLRDLHDLAAELFAPHWNGNGDDEEAASRANVLVEFFVLVTRKLMNRGGRSYPDYLKRWDHHIHYSPGQVDDMCRYRWG